MTSVCKKHRFPNWGMGGVSQPGKIPSIISFIPIPSKVNSHPPLHKITNFSFMLMYIQFMLILILINVQYLSKFVFSFKKGSSGQRQPSSVPPPNKKFPPQQNFDHLARCHEMGRFFSGLNWKSLVSFTHGPFSVTR